MKGQLLKEFLSRILVEDGPADVLNDLEIDYTYVDVDGKTKKGKAKVSTIRSKGKSHPAWEKYQALLQQRGIVDTEPVDKEKGQQKVPQAAKSLLPAPETPADTQVTPTISPEQEKAELIQQQGVDVSDALTSQLQTKSVKSNPVLANLVGLLSDRFSAAASGDKQAAIELQDIIETNKCYISQSGKFVCEGPEGSNFTSEKRDLGFTKSQKAKAKELGAKILQLSKDVGVNIKNLGKPITGESLKQSQIYTDLTDTQASVQRDVNNKIQSITIDGTLFQPSIDLTNEKIKTKLLSEAKLDEIKSRNSDWNEQQVNEQFEKIEAIIASYHGKMDMLANAIQMGKLKTIPAGSEGMAFISEQVKSKLVDKNGKAVPELHAVMDRIAKAESPAAVEDGWKELIYLIGDKGKYNKLFGDGSIPILAEHIESMYQLSLGRKVFAAMNESFQLVDVISVSSTPVSRSDIKSTYENISMIDIAVDATSVKRNLGAAAAVGSRVAVTQFKDSKRVKEALNRLGRSKGYLGSDDPGAHTQIYGAQTEEEFQKVKESMLRVVKDNMKDIRAYYGFPDNMTDDVIIEGLSNGSKPMCGGFSNKIDPNFDKECPPGSSISDLNKQQMQLYSIVGYAFDAIYNRNALAQDFSNVNYTSTGRNASNGVTVMARSEFQFNKQMKCRGGQMRDDGIASKQKNVIRNKMGSICIKK